MTLGNKIRKYRMLHNKTQKQLGEEVGFKKSTADVRINQYETDKMSPKADIRSAIAKVLDIDISAISDINIQSFEDIMYIFFELEEKLGMSIEKKDGKTYLSFDDSNKDIAMLITYMNLWKNQKDSLASDSDSSEEQKRNYELWKSKFATNISEYFVSKEKEINDYYDKPIKDLLVDYKYAEKTSEISILLRQIIEEGMQLSTAFNSNFSLYDGPGFTFTVNELLNPPSEQAKILFATFKAELNHFSELGAETYTDIQMTDKSLTITYYIPVASFSVIKSQVDKVIKHLSSADSKNDYARDTFETDFKNDIETYYNNIKEEISIHANQIKG